MKFWLLLVSFLFNSITHAQWVYYPYSAIEVDGMIVDSATMPFTNYNYVNWSASGSDSFWLNKMYIETNYSLTSLWGNLENYLFCTIYIQPGDSVNVAFPPSFTPVEFYSPDTIYLSYYSYSPGCGPGNPNTDDYVVTIQYLSDTLEQYYLNHFSPSYIDSIAIIQVRIADSLTMLKNTEAAQQLTISPNPTTGQLNFTNYYPNHCTGEIEIFDVSGAEVMRQNFEVTQGLQSNTVDMGNLPSGVYLVQYTVNGNQRMEKVVKL